MRSLWDHIAGQRRILYVSKGPSCKQAPQQLAFGHVATMNDSSRAVPGSIDFCVAADLDALLLAKNDWDRIKTFLLPDYLHVNHARSDVRPDWIPGFPFHRAIIFPVEPIAYTDEQTVQAIEETGRVALCNAATAGLHMLAMLGYREIWCLGHDGGVGYADAFPDSPADRDHSATRHRMELIARGVGGKYGVDVRFWPDRFD